MQESDAQDTAQDDTQDWFAVFTFDTNSTLAWSSNTETHIPNLKDTGTTPLAELDTSFHYAFQCSEYDDYEVEGDVQWRGKWCSIISRQNSETEKCLQADVIPGNWRGALSAVPCDRKNNPQVSDFLCHFFLFFPKSSRRSPTALAPNRCYRGL